LRFTALASGSNGNSILVETPDARLLFDAGLSGKRLQARAASRGLTLEGLTGLLVTHNHSDHVCGAGVIHRRFGTPLFMTRGTWRVSRGRLGSIGDHHEFRAGETLRFGKTVVSSIPTPHDGVDGVAYVVESEGRRVGILTDLGHPFAELGDTLPTLDAAFLESNYDPGMLESGPYPYELQMRISGPGGHLSNEECVELAAEAAGERLRTLILSHLSGENNSPGVARKTAASLAAAGVEVHLAPRTAASGTFTLGD
jgi:phosphoribosyl 1,2-cyclic phosphodiesterase